MMWDSVQHAYILSHGSCSRDYSQLVYIHFVIGRIVCDITSKMGKTLAKLLCFGSFAGA